MIILNHKTENFQLCLLPIKHFDFIPIKIENEDYYRISKYYKIFDCSKSLELCFEPVDNNTFTIDIKENTFNKNLEETVLNKFLEINSDFEYNNGNIKNWKTFKQFEQINRNIRIIIDIKLKNLALAKSKTDEDDLYPLGNFIRYILGTVPDYAMFTKGNNFEIVYLEEFTNVEMPDGSIITKEQVLQILQSYENLGLFVEYNN